MNWKSGVAVCFAFLGSPIRINASVVLLLHHSTVNIVSLLIWCINSTFKSCLTDVFLCFCVLSDVISYKHLGSTIWMQNTNLKVSYTQDLDSQLLFQRFVELQDAKFIDAWQISKIDFKKPVMKQ